MAYPHDVYPFPMDHPTQANIYYPTQIQYAPYLHQPHPEMIFTQHPFPDYADFMPMGMMPEDYDDGAEVSTRPRLTKEQVEVLEAQFQAHPKPNSMVKKQLAMQTKLTLPRVANWFQNRRAKAKQQRKQEEFGLAQSMGTPSGWKSEGNSGTTETSSKASSPVRRQNTRDDRSASIDPKSPSKLDSFRDRSWASLQRALGAADIARQQQHLQQQQTQLPQQRSQDANHVMLSMPPPDRPSFTPSSTMSPIMPQSAQSPPTEWSKARSLSDFNSPPVPVSAPIQDIGFDFGFDQEISSTDLSNIAANESPGSDEQQYIVPEESWTMAFPAQASSTVPREFTTTAQTSPLRLPHYQESRRGSGSDELTANLGTFALAGTPPVSASPLSRMPAAIRPTDGEIDIASRRKRPRPAALTSSSLRSRSYGQLTSTSPAFRPGPPSGNVLRHVKSTGHNLNSHYAGIRKSSLPQKSPLNLASFAEAESLKRLMAQQTSTIGKTPLSGTTPSRGEVGPGSISQEMSSQLGFLEDKSSTTMALPSEVLAQFHHLQSPPHTPFQTDYMMHAASLSMPPPSARSQYASFAECTPPYSAGPLTNSTCWSDAPLHSPDVTGFPHAQYMASLGYAAQQEASIQQWILPSDGVAELGLQHLAGPDDGKKTEFFITEFPGQKEEYANIAQHGTQPKPKNYVFANTAPSDYDG